MLAEVFRVLRPGGCYVCISYGRPERRRGYFERPEFAWQVEQVEIAKPQLRFATLQAEGEDGAAGFHYVYVCRKRPAAGEPLEAEPVEGRD